MKSNQKTKLIILLNLGIFFAFSPMITTNLSYITDKINNTLDYSDDFNLDKDNLKISAVSGPIYIDDNNPSSNWSVAKNTGLCNGSGTYLDPYIIEDMVIDAGGSVSGILIENSYVNFRIENCTVFNGDPAGIFLSNVNNSQLIDNNCSTNLFGIRLYFSHSNTISENSVNNNNEGGIRLDYCQNNTISGNIANNNTNPEITISPAGIFLSRCQNNIISGNIVNYNSFGIWVWESKNNTISGNIVNINTFPGIVLYYSNYTMVSGNTANNNWNGIQLLISHSNNISANTANNNSVIGIELTYSNYNIISGNNLIGNKKCISEDHCQGNEYSDNGSCTYGQGGGGIPGYNLLVLLGIIFVVVIIISKKKRNAESSDMDAQELAKKIQ